MTVADWLMDSDPSIRWQVIRDLTGGPDAHVAGERAKVATQGWAAGLLGRQGPDGRWGTDPLSEAWTSTPEWTCLMSLMALRDLGLDPASAEAQRSVALVVANVTWHWWEDKPFFAGEVEPCINGRILALGAYFGQDGHGLVERLLGEQMDDGGWNCDQECGSTRGSFNTTINVLEGLAEHERATGGNGAVRAARIRGEEYLLDRRLLRRLSTDEIIAPSFSQFSFPTSYHYDVLRALDHLRWAGALPDPRMAEALDLIEQKRGEDGRWLLENPHPDLLDLDMGEAEGQPSRWNTLRALRVLRWAGRSPA